MSGESAVSTLGLQLVAGRDFTANEIIDMEQANNDRSLDKKGISVIIAQTMADKLFPTQPALGKTITRARRRYT